MSNEELVPAVAVAVEEEAPDRLCQSSIHHQISPSQTSLLIRLCLVFAHIMFFLGQTRVMWYLYSDVEVDIELFADNLPSRLVFTALRLPNPLPVNLTSHHVLQEFTYMDAIRGLWFGRTGEPNPLYDQTPGFGGKLSAFLLVLFSAVWPHVKLLWLNVEFHRKVKHAFDLRTNTLYWLDTFGKWSLTDVFVICTLLAVLNIDVPIAGKSLVAGLDYQFHLLKQALSKEGSVAKVSLAVCQQLLGLQDDKLAQCTSRLELAFPTVTGLLTAIEHLLHHCHAEGAILAKIRVKGESGIYFFCIATLCSLGLSWLVDIVDHRMRKSRAKRERILAVEEASPDVAEEEKVEEPWKRLPERSKELGMPSNNLLLALITLAVVLLAAFIPIVERKVPGSVMSLVEADFHVDLHKQYRLYDLVVFTGEAGGWDWLLLTTLGSFILVGPILRAGVLFVLVWVPLPYRPQRRLAFASSSLGVLAAWDVIIVAFSMVTFEMPRITQGIISPKLEICKFLHQLGMQEYCISIEFLLLPGFFLLPLGTLLLLVCAARVTRITYLVYNPYQDHYSGAPELVTRLIAGS